MKKIPLWWAACLLLCGCGRVVPADRVSGVIPETVSCVSGKGVFRLSASTLVVDLSQDEKMACVADALDELVKPILGKPLMRGRATAPHDGAVNLVVDPSLAPEGYRMRIAPDGIEICGGSAAGAFYAVQTLRQLLPLAAQDGGVSRAVEIASVTIEDAPVLRYRGMMLDVCRHFFTVEEVERALELMAMHKLNVFHWHLTDDQGWRIEIGRYPELTRIGSVRRRTLIGKDPGGEYDASCRYDETPYGGYYTQDDIRRVVEYAARRFITVIPEIEFPGHAVAALAAYPWLGCTGEQYEVRQTWDIDDRVFCIGRETTFEFIEGVLDEVLALFPSEYIHIGGDECPDKMWERCPCCRRRMREEHLTCPRQLQGYATARIERYLLERGRKLIGWDEILDGGVTPTAAVMSWRGTEGGVRAARQGNEVIMAPTTCCYLDYYQTTETAGEPLAWGGYIPLSKAYGLNPHAGLTPDQQRYVLGVQANLWTEYIPTFAQAQYMLLPRLSAICEVGWSLDRKNYDRYLQRLERLKGIYDACGFEYAPYTE